MILWVLFDMHGAVVVLARLPIWRQRIALPTGEAWRTWHTTNLTGNSSNSESRKTKLRNKFYSADKKFLEAFWGKKDLWWFLWKVLWLRFVRKINKCWYDRAHRSTKELPASGRRWTLLGSATLGNPDPSHQVISLIFRRLSHMTSEQQNHKSPIRVS